MDMMEIILLIAGGIIFILSFFIPERKSSTAGENGPLAEQEMKALVSQELEAVRGHVDDVVEEAVSYAMEKTERSLERLSNEKIMAVNEYSETVLAEIHKNHEEAVFLYDMLNNKHTALKNVVAEVNSAVKDAEAVVDSLQRCFPESGLEEKAGETQLLPENGKIYPEQETVQETVEEEKSGAAETEKDAAIDGQSCNNNEKILKFYREGKTAMEIARELDLGMGEVKLVIDLFKNHEK